MPKKKYKYEITKPHDNPWEATITKRKVDVDFTMQQLDDQQRAIEKRIKELQAKRDMEAAAMENVEHFHPFVKEFSPEDLTTLFVYTQSWKLVNEINPVLKQMEDALAEHLEEVKVIKEQINYPQTIDDYVKEDPAQETT
jgi:hypothetical protein